MTNHSSSHHLPPKAAHNGEEINGVRKGWKTNTERSSKSDLLVTLTLNLGYKLISIKDFVTDTYHVFASSIMDLIENGLKIN